MIINYDYALLTDPICPFSESPMWHAPSAQGMPELQPPIIIQIRIIMKIMILTIVIMLI